MEILNEYICNYNIIKLKDISSLVVNISYSIRKNNVDMLYSYADVLQTNRSRRTEKKSCDCVLILKYNNYSLSNIISDTIYITIEDTHFRFRNCTLKNIGFVDNYIEVKFECSYIDKLFD